MSWTDNLSPATVAAVNAFFDGSGVSPDGFTITEQPDGAILIHWASDGTPIVAA